MIEGKGILGCVCWVCDVCLFCERDFERFGVFFVGDWYVWCVLLMCLEVCSCWFWILVLNWLGWRIIVIVMFWFDYCDYSWRGGYVLRDVVWVENCCGWLCDVVYFKLC